MVVNWVLSTGCYFGFITCNTPPGVWPTGKPTVISSNTPFAHIYRICRYKYCRCHQYSVSFFLTGFRGSNEQCNFCHLDTCGTDLALVYVKYDVGFFVTRFTYGTGRPDRIFYCR